MPPAAFPRPPSANVVIGSAPPGSTLAMAGAPTMAGAVTQTSEPDETLRSLGTTVGSYKILSVLGQGGMGTVYLAEHTRLGRKVAIKKLHPEASRIPRAVKRFFAEARAVNRILHENIVEITDFVEDDGDGDGDNYFIMELLRGRDLRALLEQEHILPLPRALGILVQICSGLGAVHEAGIVHRDLKPENIFLTERGGRRDFVKLLDFGIAKLMDLGDGLSMNTQRTAEGAIMGTPDYMSPEQACARPVDYRTDLYAIGVLMYELATGTLPFQATSFGDLVVQHATRTPIRPSKINDLPHAIPRELDELIMECLERDPQKRPVGMRAIEERLRAIADALSVELEAFVATPKRSIRRGLVAAGVLAGVVSLGVVLFGGGDAPEPRRAVAASASGADAPAMPEPAASTADAAPIVLVEIVFRSTPPGAQVFRSGDGTRLGVTPFVATFEQAPESETFEFRLGGYGDVTEEVSLQQGARVKVVLARAPRGPARPAIKRVAPTPPRKVTPSKKTEVLDPFDDD